MTVDLVFWFAPTQEFFDESSIELPEVFGSIELINQSKCNHGAYLKLINNFSKTMSKISN